MSRALLFATNEAYLPGVMVALGSTLLFTKSRDFPIYIAFDADAPLSDEGVSKCRALLKQFGVSPDSLRLLPLDLSIFDELPLVHERSNLVFAPLPAIDQIEEDEVLCLDADVLVLGDIDEPFQELNGDYTLAAAIDCGMTKQKDDAYVYTGGPIDPELPYFNAGVMFVNRRRLPEGGMLPAIIEVAKNCSDIPHADQSLLNILFADSWTQIPASWNGYNRPFAPCEIRLGRENPTKTIHFLYWKPWRNPRVDLQSYLWHGMALALGVDYERRPRALQLFRRQRLARKTGFDNVLIAFHKARNRGSSPKRAKKLEVAREIQDRAAELEAFFKQFGISRGKEGLFSELELPRS